MIKIAITEAAFEALARTLPLGTVAFEQNLNPQGQRYVWLEPNTVNRLKAMRGPGESYSDVIIKLVEIEGGCDSSRLRLIDIAQGGP